MIVRRPYSRPDGGESVDFRFAEQAMQDQPEGVEESSEDSDSSPVTGPAPARIEYEVLDEDDGGYDE